MLQFETNPCTGRVRVFIVTAAKTVLITDERLAAWLIEEFG